MRISDWSSDVCSSDLLLTGPEAGITRDSIAVDWLWTDPKTGEKREIRLIDTAGMRKKRNVVEKLEKLSVADARRAIDFAEVVVLLQIGRASCRERVCQYV